MRVTFVLPYAGLAGGIRVIAIYAERLKRRGHEVFLISVPRRNPKLRDRVRSLFPGGGRPVISKKRPSHLDGVDVEHRVIESVRPVTDDDVPDADVVVATWWETAEWVAALSPAKGAKAYFIQGEILEYQPVDRVKATYLLAMHKIVISQWLLKLMRNTYGDARVSLVLNSVDTQQFHAPPRGKHPIPTVGMMYSRQPWKGCDISLEAFDLAKRRLGDLRLVAFGTGSPREQLPLPDGTDYVKQPPQGSIKDLYAQCDVWLCGSRTEGFHLPPLEAMACRCPVVSTRVGGPSDVVEDGVNGYVVDTDDSAALARRVVDVLTLPDSQWRAMSDAAYATATRYTWDQAAGLFEASLITAIERSRQGETSDLPEQQ